MGPDYGGVLISGVSLEGFHCIYTHTYTHTQYTNIHTHVHVYIPAVVEAAGHVV